MIKAVLWDIGGVLLADPKIGAFWKGAHGSEELRHKFGSGKMSKREFINKASKLLRIPENKFLDEYAKAYFPITSFSEVVAVYNQTNCKSYLFSDTNPLHLDFIKAHHPKIFERADGLFLSSELGSRKADGATYPSIIRKLKLKPEEILLVDDKESVLKTAAQFGIVGCLFLNPKKLWEDLSNRGLL